MSTSAPETTTAPVSIDNWSDIVCPWCYVGKARLESALGELGLADTVEVVHHPFELDPHHGDPVDVHDMLAAKYGASPEQVAQMDQRVAELARAEGLPWAEERVSFNTFDAHRLLLLAAEAGLGNTLLDALQRAYFGGTSPIHETDALVAVAVEAGLDEDRVREVLAGVEFADQVRADGALARQIGATGVPFTVVNGKYGVPGAVSTEQYRAVIEQAIAGGLPQ